MGGGEDRSWNFGSILSTAVNASSMSRHRKESYRVSLSSWCCLVVRFVGRHEIVVSSLGNNVVVRRLTRAGQTVCELLFLVFVVVGDINRGSKVALWSLSDGEGWFEDTVKL